MWSVGLMELNEVWESLPDAALTITLIMIMTSGLSQLWLVEYTFIKQKDCFTHFGRCFSSRKGSKIKALHCGKYRILCYWALSQSKDWKSEYLGLCCFNCDQEVKRGLPCPLLTQPPTCASVLGGLCCYSVKLLQESHTATWDSHLLKNNWPSNSKFASPH